MHGVHYDTGSLTSAMHRDENCVTMRRKGRIIYMRYDCDGGMGYLFEQKWCSVCAPTEHAAAAEALAEFRQAHS